MEASAPRQIYRIKISPIQHLQKSKETSNLETNLRVLQIMLANIESNQVLTNQKALIQFILMEDPSSISQPKTQIMLATVIPNTLIIHQKEGTVISTKRETLSIAIEEALTLRSKSSPHTESKEDSPSIARKHQLL